MARKLPQGRGSYVGVNAASMVVESYINRANLNPAFDEFGVLPHSFFYTPGTGNVTAGLVRFLYSGTLPKDIVVSSAKVAITTLAAGAKLRAAVYQYTDGVLQVVPGTTVEIPTDATGHISTMLREPVTLLAGAHYWIGVVSTSITPVYGTIILTAASSALASVLRYTASTTALPSRVSVNDVQKFASGTCTFVSYLSKDAAEFL